VASSTTEAPVDRIAGSSRFPAAVRLGFSDLLDEVAQGELDREQSGRAPYDEVRLLASSGYGALRLPPGLGGRGASFTDLVEVTIELAEADSNVAHILRNHFLFVEEALAHERHLRRWLPEVAEGLLFGLGFGETDMPHAGAAEFATTLTPDGDGWVLDGVKFYSTGNLYCDRIVVKASDPTGEVATAVVPVDRDGVELVDDWDGIGQRFTGSGTTRFRAVRLSAAEVTSASVVASSSTRRAAPFAQLYLTAVVAGIVSACATDSVELVRGRSRNYVHGLAEEPRHDPVVQLSVGRLTADAFAARATVLAAARTLSEAYHSGTVHDMERASLDAARSKVVVDEVAARATSGLFDAGSASAVRSGPGLDRHWRNARTVIAHNPASYKLRVLGDHALNDTPPPVGSFF
jgi:alkylation response protein AidB-like acyl-CoA dehydrogenase